jgi:DNA invertase Pin-like site-specific DNA recombinase
MKKYNYMRVSTQKQSNERQRALLKEHFGEADAAFEEKASGKAGVDRPAFKKLLEVLQPGDQVRILDATRMSRSLIEMYEYAKIIVDKGATLIIKQPDWRMGPNDPADPFKNFTLCIMAGVAEFERYQISRRIRETVDGIRRGEIKQQKGRPIIRYGKINRIKRDLQDGKSYRQIAREHGVSITSISRIKNCKIGEEEEAIA